MFIARDVVLDVPVGTARDRLSALVRGGTLVSSSAAAYQDGLEGVIRVGPFGDVPGVSKLVRVQFLEPVERDGVASLGMRWEAEGTAGALFPVLDADIRLTPAEGDATRLELVGSYRPPLGFLGAGLDRAILNRVAAATVRALLRSVAAALADPPLVAQEQEQPPAAPVVELIQGKSFGLAW